MNQRFQHAASLYQAGDLRSAERVCRELLARSPEDFNVLSLSGVISARIGDLKKAEQFFSRAISINDRDPGCYFNLANVFLGQDNDLSAKAMYEHALRLDDHHVGARLGLGAALARLKDFPGAERNFRFAAQIAPQDPHVFYNYGNFLFDSGRYAEAITQFDACLAIDPAFVPAYNNKAMCLIEDDHETAAIEVLEKAVAMDPRMADLHNNLGIAYAALTRYEDAVGCYSRAIECDRNYVDARWNLGLAQLVLGDFGNGWRNAEWRWESGRFDKWRRKYNAPYLDPGRIVRDKKVLIFAEQGIGDTLQFYRYAKLLARKCKSVTVAVQPQLFSLLAGLGDPVKIIHSDDVNPETDYHCSVVSLPYIFQATLASIPGEVPYIACGRKTAERWADILGARIKPRIGVAWSGNPDQQNDKNRSMPLSRLRRLFEMEEFEWISLQKDVRSRDVETLGALRNVRHFGDQLENFEDTAGIVENLDLIISVCTSVAHLVGAMGKPVWVLLSFNADWRWLKDRVDSPWYPTARLFRQKTKGDWDGVVDRVCARLREHGSPRHQ